MVSAPANTNVQESKAEVQEMEHDSNINDSQFDHYGISLASCDSNGFIQVSSVNTDPAALKQVSVNAFFKAHDGPAWQVAWAHPKYESVIASCGYDRWVKVWKEANG
jgi:protein transport protein SEC13